MAIITKLDRGILVHPQKCKETTAIYYVIDSLDEKYLQIDTFGSKERKFPHKASQSIRLNKEMGKQIINILKNEFEI